MILFVGYSVISLITFNYWQPRLKAFGVFSLIIVPLMLVIWKSAPKYTKVFETVLKDYAVIEVWLLSTVTNVLSLRHEMLFFIVSSSTLILSVLTLIEILCDNWLHINDIEMMYKMGNAIPDTLLVLYIVYAIFGVVYYKNPILLVSMIASYIITKLILLAIIRKVIEKYDKKAKNNK